jgi:hypothetical protein
MGADNITTGQPGSWKRCHGISLDEALETIYQETAAFSAEARAWYWTRIRYKRRFSVVLRAAALILVIVGALLPLSASLRPLSELLLLKLALVALAFAGLLQAVDRALGYSSGWLRYILTVTAMEAATRRFRRDWHGYLLARGSLTTADAAELFALARRCEDELIRLQDEETEKWIAEFNASLAVIDGLIRSSREALDKTDTDARERRAVSTAAAQSGVILVTLKHAGEPAAVDLTLDAAEPQRVIATSWVFAPVAPGSHTVRVESGNGVSAAAVAIVPAGQTCTVEIDVP